MLSQEMDKKEIIKVLDSIDNIIVKSMVKKGFVHTEKIIENSQDFFQYSKPLRRQRRDTLVGERLRTSVFETPYVLLLYSWVCCIID